MKKLPLLVILLTSVFITAQSSHAVGIFMKASGDGGFPSGDKSFTSNVQGYEEWTEVLAISMGASQSASFHNGGNPRAGSRADFQDISITKWADTLTPYFLLALANGSQIEKVEITWTLDGNENGAKPTVFSEIILDKVIVSSLSGGSSVGENTPTENLSLNWAKLTMKAYEIDAKGGSNLKRTVVIDAEQNVFQ